MDAKDKRIKELEQALEVMLEGTPHCYHWNSANLDDKSSCGKCRIC